MKNKKVLISLASTIIVFSLLAGCANSKAEKSQSTSVSSSSGTSVSSSTSSGASSSVSAITKRAVRKFGNDAALLPAPTKFEEQSGDKERFDSYVYTVENLKKNYDSVVVLDARPKEAYDKGHLPNAVRAHWKDWSNVSVKQDSGEWAVIKSNEELSKLFGELGIDGTKPVVIYTESATSWGEEGRQLWTFRVFGLNNTYILNGGIKAWQDAGGEVTKDAPKVKPVTGPKANPNTKLFADTAYVLEKLGKVNILDTREDAEFAGTNNYGEISNGRIPNVKHIWFKDFYNADGTLLSPAQIRARVNAVGYKQSDEIITYCTGGIRSGFTAILLQAAGFENARNYNASFSGWAGTKQKIDSVVLTELETNNNLN